ncbi:MAG TPA: tetratricopeptide repeat protein [Candidatus Solibacter sp.]
MAALLCVTAAAQGGNEGAALLERGYALAGQGNREEAIGIYRQALELNRRALGEKHLLTLTNMNLLASAYLMNGNLIGAEPLVTEIVSTARELYPRDIQLSEALGSWSYILSRRGRLAEAETVAGEALALSLATEGEDSINSAMMYANAGGIHRLEGQDARALPLFRKALAIYEKKLDPADPRIGSLLSQEGLILMRDRQFTLADRAMSRAVDLLRQSCPGCVTENWIAESNLALLRLAQNRYEEADRLFTHVISLRETAEALRGLAIVREKERRHKDAVLLRQRANQLLAYQ